MCNKIVVLPVILKSLFLIGNGATLLCSRVYVFTQKKIK